MRRNSICVAGLAALALSACGGSGGGTDSPPFAGFSPGHAVLPSPGGPQDFRFGASVAWLHWNDDGRLDLLVGAPNHAGGAFAGVGAALLYTQNVDGTFALARTFAPTSWSGISAAASANFGAAVAAGDLDGDGRDDVVIGAPGDAVGAALAAGRVYVVFNDAAQVGTLVGPISEPGGAQAGAEFGGALAVGRLNGDLFADVVVSAVGATVATHPGAGRVVGLLGSSSATFGGSTTATIASPTPDDDAGFGAQVAVGDVNGDGLADLAVGEPGAAVGSGGAVHVFGGDGAATPTFGLFRSLSADEAGTFVELGASVAIADVDGDGDRDVIAGAPFGDVGLDGLEGYVIVFRNANPALGGFTALAPLTDRTPEGGAEFGAGLLATDLDGDGTPDLVVSAPAASVDGVFGAGSVTAFVATGGGSFGAPDADDVLSATTPATDTFFGSAIAGGDTDGDGVLDLLAVGAPGSSDPLDLQAGGVEVIRKN